MEGSGQTRTVWLSEEGPSRLTPLLGQQDRMLHSLLLIQELLFSFP